MNRKTWLIGGGAVLAVSVACLGTAFVVATPPADDPGAGQSAPTATAQVKRQKLVVSDRQSGTLGYAGEYHVTGNRPGVLTGLPPVGQVITQGKAVFHLDGRPVPLWHGDTPFWRPLEPGVEAGVDVRELEQNLKDLGYFRGAVDRKFTDATAAAIKNWQKALGLEETGKVEPGSVVVLPTDIRVTAVTGVPGAAAQGKILDASGTGRVVTVKMPVSKQSEAVAGSEVDITLLDGTHTPGTITSVGTVAREPDPNGGNPASGHEPTVDVQVTPKNPDAVGKLDGAPVTVAFTSEQKDNVLTVPVGALLATPEGGYAVETVDGRLLPVELGLFANSLVEVSGAGIHEGMAVKAVGS
ncbi:MULTISPECIES: peptidoglycan-binding domain-containing protein [Amycolatopsis]|uniref:Peptidoglycan-binding protein n=2 Tax=Amycolatopsis TaxID=1813 RepID=A0ABP9QP94_9PSEU|nr:peptidoglycan-binding domain-containing protein [Amycolatopsis sacchari]SFK08716.1 Putative peptidoglycan binding domain-containing protein [Amycolatopsis sacchari]